MSNSRIHPRRLLLAATLWLGALLVAGLLLAERAPDARAQHGGQPGGQVEHISFIYHGTEGGTAQVTSAHPGTAHAEAANPIADGAGVSVVIDDGPVTSYTLQIGSAVWSLHASCSLAVSPGLIFAPGEHNIVGAIAEPSLEVTSLTLGNGAEVNDLCSGATVPTPTPTPTESPTPEPTESPTPEPTPTESPTPEPTASPTPEPTASPTPEPTVSPTPEPTASPTPTSTAPPAPTQVSTPVPTPEPTETPVAEVAGTTATVEKVLTTFDPARVGETVGFQIALNVSGDQPLSDVGLLDTYENAYLRFEQSSPAGCALFEQQPDNAHDLVACEIGDVAPGTHTFVFDLEFTAVAPTTPDRTLNEVVGVVDGGQVGPASADVEIVEVLSAQLPPAGDGSSLATQGANARWLMLATFVVLSASGSILLAASIKR
jgi:hypothetical protein